MLFRSSLKRNVGLTVLMIAAIAVGIGASMIVLVVYRAEAGDPIPGKARQLYAVQVDNWGSERQMASSSARSDDLEDQLSYTDAVALVRAHAAKRQAAMYASSMTVVPENAQLSPFIVSARATHGDFFAMFDVPFVYGSAWPAAADEDHAKVVVISNKLNQSLFDGANSVGRHVRFMDGVYRVAGVIADWRPVPRFYDLTVGAYGDTEQVFLPFTTAVDDNLPPGENTDCNKSVPGGRSEERRVG